MTIEVAVFGASGQARSVAEIFLSGQAVSRTGRPVRFTGFVSDVAQDREAPIDGYPVFALDQLYRDHPDSKLIISVGAPSAKRAVAERISDTGGQFVEAVWDCSIGMRSRVEIGEGTYLGFGSYVGPGCTIGRHVAVLTRCSIAHDVIVGDCVTICPGTILSGNVVVEDNVFLGAGAVVVPGSPRRPVVIGAGAVIAAGAVVTKSVAAGETVVGNPAVPVRDWASTRAAEKRARRTSTP